MMRRITAWVIGVAVLATGVAYAQNILINAAGATFPYPIYSKWFDEYHKKFPTLQFNYQSIGSGGGIKQVTEGTVEFGATDGPMNDMQLK
jgi:phosphate transport system substrate-binding protein